MVAKGHAFTLQHDSTRTWQVFHHKFIFLQFKDFKTVINHLLVTVVKGLSYARHTFETFEPCGQLVRKGMSDKAH